MTSPSLSSAVGDQRKVMLLSRSEGLNLVRLIESIRQTGCNVALVVTALGYNYSLNEKNYDDLATRIRLVHATVRDPPPIMTITGITQLLPFLQAIDPDLVITCLFPYQLTKSFLAHRSIKINMHPSPLPLYRGNSATGHMLLQQLSSWTITWHYITEEYDTGNILIQQSFPLQTPYGIAELSRSSLEAIFATVSQAIEMSLARHPGTPQRQPTSEEEPFVYPKPLTIAERTITSDLTCHQILILIEACKYFPPALFNAEGRLYHVIEARRVETPLPFTLASGEVRRVLNRYVHQCADGIMEYVVRII